MTRVTAFGMPKKGPVGSTWEELTGKAESSDMGAKRAADESGSKDSDGDKKRKRPQADSAEGGASSGGWGRNEDVRRKADKSEQRRVGRIENKNASTVCFACRQKGHAARECPNVLLAAQTPDAPVGQGEAQVQKGMKRGKGKMGSDVAGSGGRCYRCDSTQHPLSRCPKPASVGLPFASCFICLQKGHLASTCPQNDRGVYPNGGSCKVCGKVDHRASDCPDDKRGKRPEEDDVNDELKALGDENGAVVFGIGSGAGADEDDFMVVKRRRVELEKKAAEKKTTEKAQKLAKKIKEKRDFDRQTREIAGETGVFTGNADLPENSAPAPKAQTAPAKTQPVVAAAKVAPAVKKAPSVARVPKKPKVVVF